MTNDTVNHEPKWRHNGPALTTGYNPHYPDALPAYAQLTGGNSHD
jgi:hydrogenase small subunit